MIQHFDVGEAMVNGIVYNEDIIIDDEQVTEWIRDETNIIKEQDISEILEKKPDTIIFGTGTEESLILPENGRDEIEAMGIDVITAATDKAVDLYNELSRNKRKKSSLASTWVADGRRRAHQEVCKKISRNPSSDPPKCKSQLDRRR